MFIGYLQFGLDNQSEVRFNIKVNLSDLLFQVAKDLARDILLLLFHL